MNGIWNAEFAQHHQSSEKLAKWLVNYLPTEDYVIDFGCGTGYYMGFLEKNDFETTGIDGFAIDNPLCSNFIVHDLTKPIELPIEGSVISLEVGEHLPKEAQETFINTLVSHCAKHLILSWAEIGQPGIGHINCRSQEDVINDIVSRGFEYLPNETQDARNNIDDNCDWFKRTLLIFRRCTH
jgi:cyclopropane fatty-acyl-phospholipid synthase-like methyltransferase